MAVTKMGQLEVAGGTKQPAAVCSLCKPHTVRALCCLLDGAALPSPLIELRC
jgi:hypothetical protein